MKYLLVLLVIISFTSCSEKPSEKRLVTNDKMVQFVPKDSGTQYLPFGTIQGDRNYLEKWASADLLDVREPVLNNYSGEGEFVRLIWLRTFENPIVIRVNKFRDTVYSNIKVLKTKSFEAETPKIVKDTIIALDENSWQEIKEPLESNAFLNATYNEDYIGKDGAIWFLEYRIPQRYHVIRRWDDGYLTSKELNNYLVPLIKLSNEVVQVKSSR